MRVPQIVDGKFERFDLIGSLRGENGEAGRTVYLECKEYSSDGNQPQLYDEYLAVCYSAFVKLGSGIAAPPNIEFMWATTHPFAQTTFTALTTADRIARGCSKFPERLGEHEFDDSIAE